MISMATILNPEMTRTLYCICVQTVIYSLTTVGHSSVLLIVAVHMGPRFTTVFPHTLLTNWASLCTSITNSNFQSSEKMVFLSECLSRIFPVSYLCLVTLYTLRYMPDPGGKYCTASYSCFCNSFRGNLCLWHQVQSSDPRLEKEEYSGGSWQSWVLWAWYRVTVREWWGEIHHFILLHTHNHGAVRGTDTPPLAHQYSWQKSNISGLTEHYSHMQLFLHFFPVI